MEIPTKFRMRRWSAALYALVTGLLLTAIVLFMTLQRTGSPPNNAPIILGTTASTLVPYIEQSSHFQVSYPATWVVNVTNPGVEFADDTNAPHYIVQILLPSQDADLTTDWVSYELDQLRITTNTATLTVDPTMVTTTIGNQTWTGRNATFTLNGNPVAVLVYSTVYQERAYVINLLAMNTSMTAAQTRWFHKILATFTFLP